MQTTRRAVRPDGQYYRESRRQRLMRSIGGGSARASRDSVAIALVAGGILLVYWGWHGGRWAHWIGFGGAALAVSSVMFRMVMRRR